MKCASIRKCSSLARQPENIKRQDPLEIKINKNSWVLGKGSLYERSLRPIKMFSFCSLFRKKNKFEFVRVEICFWAMRFISLDSIASRCSSSASAEKKRRDEEKKVMSSLTLHGQSALHAAHTERNGTAQGKAREQKHHHRLCEFFDLVSQEATN